MREIFFDEKLGETQRNSEGVRAARAEMGCERWEGVEAVGGVRIKRVSLFGDSLFILTMKNV